MYNNKYAPEGDNTRLYDLLVHFQQGDHSSYQAIIERFSGLIHKASYNSYMGAMDDDLRSEIYLTLFLRLSRFSIPGRETFSLMAGQQDAPTDLMLNAQV
jgi:hypothetical protein